jgi:hypothetical protein
MDRREELIAAAVDAYELHANNVGISCREDDLAGPAFAGLAEVMAEEGHGTADDLRRFIEEHNAEIWHRVGENWFTMHELRRGERD